MVKTRVNFMTCSALAYTKAQVGHILSERNILLQIEHPFIVNMAATFQGAFVLSYPLLLCFAPIRSILCMHKFADSASLYLVLEYVCGGEFFTHLREKVMLEVDSAKFYAAQVASIFAYLHERVRPPSRVPRNDNEH